MRKENNPFTGHFSPRIIFFLLPIIAVAIVLLFVFLQPNTSPSYSLLPGEQIWKGGVSSYLFGTNNTYNWSSNNIETNTTAQQYLRDAHIPLIRTWFFSPYGDYSKLATDAETDKRLQVDAAIGAQCLGVLEDTDPQSAQYYMHLVQYVGNRCLIYEFGNEPGSNGAPGIEHYIQYWNALIPQLRKINPNAKFGGPVGDMSDIQTFLTGTKQSGVLPDFLSFHNYNHDPAAFGQKVTQAKQLAKSILGHELPVGISEFNYDCCDPFNADDTAFETHYFTAAYNGLIAAHADFATEFDSMNHGGNNMLDMFDASAQPRGVYTVIKNMIAQYSPVASTPSTGPSNTLTAPSLVLLVFILLILLFRRQRLNPKA